MPFADIPTPDRSSDFDDGHLDGPYDPDEFLDPAEERAELTDELLAIGRELADLPEDGEFGRRLDLRERQKELRLRLAQLEDVPNTDVVTDDDRVIDLEHDELVDVQPPTDLYRL